MAPPSSRTPLQADEDSGALPRALSVLRHIAHAEQALGNRELSELTGIPKATTSRITARLMAAGLIRQKAGNERFELGPGVLELARAFLDRLDLRATARTHLTRLAEETGVAAHLGIRDRLEIVLVEAVQPKAGALITRLGVGSRLALTRSAAGRAYLAGLPAAERAALLNTLAEAGDGLTLESGRRLDEALQAAKEQGFCSSFGDWSPEVNAIGAYVRAPDGELYCITCGGPAYRFAPELLTGLIAERLACAVSQICRETGASSSFPATADDRPPVLAASLDAF